MAHERKSRRAPKLRLRLRTVLIIASLFALVLPLTGLYALRLHESTLLQQTQSELVVVAAMASSAYASTLGRLSGAAETQRRTPMANKPPLGFAETPVLPPQPPAQPGPPAEQLAEQAGAILAPVLADAKVVTRAAIRLLDRQGVVVASTEDDMGLSLAHVDEVRQALAGDTVNSLRTESSGASLAPIVRGTQVRVVLAVPVMADAAASGAVVVSRRPSSILDTLYDKRYLLLQVAFAFIAVAIAVALLAARTILLPMRRIVRGARRVSRGETEQFERERPFRVVELADLAGSIGTMVTALQRRSAYLRDFAHQLNHQFKTPIAAARAGVELLGDSLADMTPAEARHFVDNVKADIERIDRLASRLLELAQADMTGASDEVTDVLAVAGELPHREVRVEGAAPMLAQVPGASVYAILENLVDNATSHGASRVDIRGRTVGEAVELRVADNGSGISPRNRKDVFDPFFTTRQSSGGTGLGLAICRTLANNAGGDIELLPTETGAAFKVTLRAAQRAAAGNS